MEKEGNFITGLLWGSTLGILLWVAFIGWIKLLKDIM